MSELGSRHRFVDVHWFDELDSTNTWLLDAAGRGAAEGTVAVADRQSAGRGRLGRRWESPGGSGLLASVLFRPHLEPAELFAASALVALAGTDAIESVAGVSVGAKWPNDLVVGDRKLAGVLAETSGAGTDDLAVVVGIGINVSWPMPGDEATELNATCLEALSGGPIDRASLLDAMLDSVERRRPQLDSAPGRASLIAELESCTVSVGRTVRVQASGEALVGTALGLDAQGRLILDVGGERCVVAVGDVMHLR
jgi:BirA family biotin operon repressor/biotin-[acetyl-CoA-carboxylase] ligase